MAKKEKLIVLVVEDEEVLLRAIYLSLHNEGYTVATATDGESALDMANRLNPNIILLDLLLPKTDGFEFLKKIKAIPTLEEIPVIVLSNLGDETDTSKAKKLGAVDYFVKADTDLAVLSKKIKEILSQHKK
jgi:DNA-binding response OmpR family regulator